MVPLNYSDQHFIREKKIDKQVKKYLLKAFTNYIKDNLFETSSEEFQGNMYLFQDILEIGHKVNEAYSKVFTKYFSKGIPRSHDVDTHAYREFVGILGNYGLDNVTLDASFLNFDYNTFEEKYIKKQGYDPRAFRKFVDTIVISAIVQEYDKLFTGQKTNLKCKKIQLKKLEEEILTCYRNNQISTFDLIYEFAPEEPFSEISKLIYPLKEKKSLLESYKYLDSQKIARLIDHTLLRADATPRDIKNLCQEAYKYNFASVCVNPTYVSQAKEFLNGTNVRVCTVVGFPLGANTINTKVMETKEAIANGADEIDMVINIGALKSNRLELVLEDIRSVVDAAKGAPVKVILETGLLTDEEKIKGCLLAEMGNANFVKTSTGFGPRGATIEDIELMALVVGSKLGIKASGGIRDLETAKKMVAAGATRLGTSASVSIIEEEKQGRTKCYSKY